MCLFSLRFSASTHSQEPFVTLSPVSSCLLPFLPAHPWPFLCLGTHSLCWLLAVSVRFTSSSGDLTGISCYTPPSASIYRSHGFSASMSQESSLCRLSLSQVMRRSHETREKLLRLGIFRQVDVLIDTCHGRCHGECPSDVTL